jgi:hypothetical protein
MSRRIEVDGLEYGREENYTWCSAPFSLPQVFPRNVISTAGILLHVDLLTGDDPSDCDAWSDNDILLLTETIFVPFWVAELSIRSFKEFSFSAFAFESGSRLSFIAGSAFRCCDNLLAICIPSTVHTLRERCFEQCDSLSAISFAPGSVLSSIESRVFMGCSSLSSISIPSSVATLGHACFYKCTSLVTVRFQSGSRLSSLGSSAFASCSSLSAIFMPPQLETVFRQCSDIRAMISIESGSNGSDPTGLADSGETAGSRPATSE